MTGGHDLVVIGGGAAGLGAARAAAGAGARVLLVTDGPPGGDCTFTGCVPSKTLIEAAARGLAFDDAVRRMRAVIARIAATEDDAALRAEGIEVRRGRARFVAPGRVDVDGTVLAARRYVVATGAVPAVPSVPGLADVPYLTTETVFDLASAPGSLIVLGGGPVGCELAQAYARFGTRVTVVETADRLLPGHEPAVSAVIADVFAREGITLRLGAQVVEAGTTVGGVTLRLADGSQVHADRLLVATGRRPTTDGLDLPAAGIAVDDRGHVITDAHLATTAPGGYAAGDVTGRMPFTHAAFAMGRIAAGNALSRRRQRYDPAATPWVVFTDPEVARVGLTEAQSVGRGGRVAYLPMTEMDRAVTADATDGFVTLVAGPRRLLGNLGGGRILGATVVAGRAGEMIHEPALAMATGMFAGRLAQATHAYPTWSYGIQLAAAQFVTAIGGRRARPARAAG
ncbi:FAD-dependent oxidoreductase [Solwaraspora sp. WMMD792]|uniref:dihydrolipoyl dehydrogenase family protein n=1 Tax=Solwaraspora sp. WMMD792 TaxID=3016099 RepID=UPI002417E29A|nr:FAD-dependent oxidoreductase [Solwaraspora sp. WMMD792]MDG4771707.1 FAD-dependent oxidoreductase [Solwaraspora sp. WMMD792]